MLDERPHLPLRLASGNRVLLVEDEVLVAMMMRDLLAETGLTVVGPFGRLSEAMIAAVHQDLDAGIIDVNLGGEFVYPVADVLVARGIPFVFVTGYGVESIDGRFGQVPIIKKPVQRQALQKIFLPPEDEERAAVASRRYGTGRESLSRAAAGRT
jgi:two-component SAPR family response regulator